jgi:hypothetical protein
MAPEEKAQELVDKFNIDIEPFSEYGKWDEYLAKKCALIAVDEILNTSISKENYFFWTNVKHELKKL